MATSSNALKQVYMVEGVAFDTAAEAREFMRQPQVKAAVSVLVGGDANFMQFLLTNQDEIEKAFESGVIARVTKAERTKLNKAFDYIAEALKGDGKAKFVVDNIEAAKESFRWPAVKRLSDDEKAAATLAALTKLADEKVAGWLLTNKVALLGAYGAGVEKRAAPAGNGLAEYLAAKKAGPEALAEYQAKQAAAKAAKQAEAAAAKQ
jgi:hypothetical protein